MTECARAGLGQSLRIATGLRIPSPAKPPELYFPNVSGQHEHVGGKKNSASTGAVPRFFFACKDTAKGGLEQNPTHRAGEGSFTAASAGKRIRLLNAQHF